MLSDILHTYPVLIWTILYTAAAAIVLSLMWDKLKWWWLNTWYNFPVIGKTARLSKDLHQTPDGSGWFKSERTLCQDYKAFIQVQSEYDFNQRMTYLQKADDNGRTLTPLGIWALIIGFVFVEAQGFSYVLAGYTVPGASETTQKYAALGIAFIVSAACVLATHAAGHELYRTLKVRRARREWVEDGRKHKLRSRSMPLSVAQHLDDDQPEYTQVCNRVRADSGFVVSWGTLIFVLIIAAGATYVRVQSANKLMQDAVRTQKSELVEQHTGGAAGLDLRQQNVIPESDAKSSLDADGKAVDEAAQYDLHGYWVTFAILAVLFVFLQGLGVLFGYRWGFAGENSKDAFKALGKGKYLTYGDVRAASQKFIDKAQNQLENLQQRMIQYHAEKGTGAAVHPSRSFLEFLDATDQQEADYRNKKRAAHQKDQMHAQEDHEHAEALKNKAAQVKAAAQRVEDEKEAAPVQQQVPAAVVRSSAVLAAVEQLDRIGDDAEARSAFLGTLPEETFNEVKLVLKERKQAKEKEAARKQRAAEIEDLL